MMKYEEIQHLLDRYWEGETSIEEERSIKAYFKAGLIDPRLKPLVPLFAAFQEEQTVQFATKGKKVAMRPLLYLWAVAASLAVLLTVTWCVFQSPEPIAQPVAGLTPQVPISSLPHPNTSPITPAYAEATASNQSLTSTHPRIPKSRLHRTPKSAPQQIPHKNQQEIDPETAQAMEEIKAALALVSSKLGKGRTQAIKGASYLDALDKVPKRDDG